MTIQRFISLNEPAWEQLRTYLRCMRSGGPDAIPSAELQAYSSLYRQSVADLAYARAHSPEHPVVSELEALVAAAHSNFYRPPASRILKDLVRFVTEDFPDSFQQSWAYVAAAAAIFFVSMSVGFILSFGDADFAQSILPSEMMDAFRNHDHWTGHLGILRPLQTSDIGTHNVTISLLAFASGITLVGPLYLLILNGTFLGAGLGTAARYGMLGDLVAFVIPHGALEIPQIFLSGGAGLMVGWTLLLPGRYNRGEAVRKAASTAMNLGLGTIPILTAAALIEANFSSGQADWSTRLCVGALAFSTLLAYTLGRPFYKRLRSFISR